MVEGIETLMELVRAEDIKLDVAGRSKPAALDAVSVVLARKTEAARQEIFQALAARERLGSTAVNDGIAIPHAGLAAIASPAVALVRLDKPIDFDAPDGVPVDLVTAVVWPAGAKDGFPALLAQMFRLLSKHAVSRGLRGARSPSEARALLLAAGQATPPAMRIGW